MEILIIILFRLFSLILIIICTSPKDLLVESELLLMAVTIVRLLALLPGEAGTWWAFNSQLYCLQVEAQGEG